VHLLFAALQDYAYTMAAAYRSEQRRLLSFIRMSDFMMCDTLHTVLVESVREVLESVRPAVTVGVPPGSASGSSGSSRRGSAVVSPAKRSLQTMHTLLNGSRRQRQSAALAGMQLAPVTAAQQQAAAAAAAADGGSAVQRTPVFELQVLLTQSLEELAFDPEPEQFQVNFSWSTCFQIV
jgi:dynein heavy chain